MTPFVGRGHSSVGLVRELTMRLDVTRSSTARTPSLLFVPLLLLFFALLHFLLGGPFPLSLLLSIYSHRCRFTVVRSFSSHPNNNNILLLSGFRTQSCPSPLSAALLWPVSSFFFSHLLPEHPHIRPIQMADSDPALARSGRSSVEDSNASGEDELVEPDQGNGKLLRAECGGHAITDNDQSSRTSSRSCDRVPT